MKQLTHLIYSLLIGILVVACQSNKEIKLKQIGYDIALLKDNDTLFKSNHGSSIPSLWILPTLFVDSISNVAYFNHNNLKIVAFDINKSKLVREWVISGNMKNDDKYTIQILGNKLAVQTNESINYYSSDLKSCDAILDSIFKYKQDIKYHIKGKISHHYTNNQVDIIIPLSSSKLKCIYNLSNHHLQW